jgi:hypothetical protein
MKKLIISILFTCVFSYSKSQELISEKCNWEDVKITVIQDKIPEGYVVVGNGSILVDKPITSLSELTAKQLKKIKKHGRMFRSCEVYLDINRKVYDPKQNQGMTEKHIPIIVVLKRKSA